MIDQAYGAARAGVEMTPGTLMLWMSAGKPITALAILQLIASGELALDTRVADVVPGFGVSGKNEVTIRHCLTHTAGFRGPLNNFAPGPWESIIERVCALKQEPNWTPGEKAGYHVASSWFALGEVIQRITQEPFEAFVQTNVLRRANANTSTFTFAVSHGNPAEYNLARVIPDSPGNILDNVPRPGASLRGTARDLANIYQSLLDHDDRLLPEKWSRAMIARQRVEMFDETFKQITDWGLGVKLDSKRYARPSSHAPSHPEQYGYGPHASDDTFGHSGSQCSCAFADPKHDLVVAWCFNHMPGEPAHQARQNAVNAAIYEDLGLA